MEEDHSNKETSKQAAANDHNVSSSSSGARSYDCIFCKRGFSNAQALGGHMNIHRKERSKLKQPSSRTRSSPLDTTNNVIPSNYPTLKRSFMSGLGHASGDRGLLFKWPWISPREQDTLGAYQQALFINRSWRGDGRHNSYATTLHQHMEVDGLGSEGPAVMELDLELRLGPVPRSASIGYNTIEGKSNNNKAHAANYVKLYTILNIHDVDVL
ncbi:hypothetical protein J5N97_015020 [Dioscorea zingiberensis]|uniref:C2H2-type domain-containing protein n=1 Tax=Dioscorea zingiberensis TaxID=325984 RepID=A0A9D5HK92_9LILI|nr:hypothetical protein J5N97_015020 [Dioscorea zingiberensis]